MYVPIIHIWSTVLKPKTTRQGESQVRVEGITKANECTREEYAANSAADENESAGWFEKTLKQSEIAKK